MAESYAELTAEKLQTPDGVAELNRILNALVRAVEAISGNIKVYTGYGSPESVIPANIGSLYLRADGGASTTLYVKTSGSADTGWTAK